MEIAEEVFAHDDRVVVEGFHGLLVNYVKSRQANVILRGMRAVSDFEFEFQMALMNRKLDRSIETVFIMTDLQVALHQLHHCQGSGPSTAATSGAWSPKRCEERMLRRFGPDPWSIRTARP